MSNTNCSASHPVFVNLCTLPAGHPGYHGDGDISWAGPMTRTGRRLDFETIHVKASDPIEGATLAHIATCRECWERFGGSGLVPASAAAEARRLLAQPKPAVQRDPLRWGRERWHFAGRVSLVGPGDRYRWELRDDKGHVLDTEYRAVSTMIGGK